MIGQTNSWQQFLLLDPGGSSLDIVAVIAHLSLHVLAFHRPLSDWTHLSYFLMKTVASAALRATGSPLSVLVFCSESAGWELEQQFVIRMEAVCCVRDKSCFRTRAANRRSCICMCEHEMSKSVERDVNRPLPYTSSLAQSLCNVWLWE